MDPARNRLERFECNQQPKGLRFVSVCEPVTLREDVWCIGVAVVVGLIVVYMAMYTAVLERTREIGILKSLGASLPLILSMLLKETLLFACLVSAGRHPVELWNAMDNSTPYSIQFESGDCIRMVAFSRSQCRRSSGRYRSNNQGCEAGRHGRPCL
jgi:hypothetical protein